MGRPSHASAPSFWRLLRLFPPIVVRLNARVPTAGKHRRAISHEEIAITAGMPLSRILDIAESLTWETVTIGEAERFCAACRFDPTSAADRERMTAYLRLCQKKHPNKVPHYLRSSPLWATQFLPLICRLRTSIPPSAGSNSAPDGCSSCAA